MPRSILLLFCGLSLTIARGQMTYPTLYVDYDSAWQFRNLKIVPVRIKGGGGTAGVGEGDILSLSRALAGGAVTITERGSTSFDNVHWLRINTHSDKSVFIGGGEVVAGGRQDRMVIRDTILHPSEKDQYVPVMCVEEGRWSNKEKKFAYGEFANPHLRKVLDSSRNQVMVWREVGKQLQQGAFKNTTLSYLARNQDKKYLQLNEEYYRFFLGKFQRSDSNVVGFVAISGDKIAGADLFAGPGLFYQQLEPLLHGYIDDAALMGTPPVVTETALHRYMDKLLKDAASQEAFVKTNGTLFRQDGRIIHINMLSSVP